MRRFKKVTAFALSAAMIVSMIGCGKKSDKKDDVASGSDVVATNDDATTQAVIEDDGDWPTTEAEQPDSRRFTTIEGADAFAINFDDGQLNGFATYSEGGVFTIDTDGGEMVADIKGVGTAEHGCQIYYDGLTMANGCVYEMSFDVRSTIPRRMQWRVQLNGGDYHAYAGEYLDIGPDTTHVSLQFTMEEASDPAPRFALNIGRYDGEMLDPHQIYFDNFSMYVVDSSNAEVIQGAPIPIQVKVNQIGYEPEDVKTVLVTSGDDTKFKVVDAETEETVFIGGYGKPAFDASMGDTVLLGDFTALQTPGRYKVISSPSGASYEFSIGEGLYDDIYKDVVLMLYNQRCGTEIDSAISGPFAHEACHMQEAYVYGEDPSKTYDVSGGWHDAGDYGRYVVPGAKTVQDLFLAYEDYNYDSDAMGIPESGNGVPDLLDEAKYELDWMLKMQNPENGGVYHKVTGLVFPGLADLPQDETCDMVLAPISYNATADFVAVMAKASVVYADYDPDFAATCLEAAKKGYEFMLANPDMTGFKNPEEILTGEYPDQGMKDETFWACAELYIATGDDTYLAATKAAMGEKYSTGLGWASIGTYPLYDLAKAEGIDATLQQTAKDKFIELAESKLNACKKSHAFLGQDSYPWGSNMLVAGTGELLLMANTIEPNPEFVEYAKKQRDYIFGVNGTGYCYVTGYGALSPVDTHHRPSLAMGQTLPGMLVGGANQNLEDPYSAAVLYGRPGACAYVDSSQSFSCNEITIYWNSPLIYLMTGLTQE